MLTFRPKKSPDSVPVKLCGVRLCTFTLGLILAHRAGAQQSAPLMLFNYVTSKATYWCSLC